MGMYSWLCKSDVCTNLGAAVIPPAHVTADDGLRDHAWMTSVTAVRPSGDIVQGTYDGYGCASGADLGDADAIWHTACWEAAGRPGHNGPSAHDPTQGRMGYYAPNDDGYDEDRAAYDRDAPAPTAASQAFSGHVALRTYLDVSVAHLSKAEADALSCGDLGVAVAPQPHGWWVHVAEHDPDDGSLADMPNLTAVLNLARDLGATWVKFDTDSPGLDLPTFNW
jgi:hypothetical protein